MNRYLLQIILADHPKIYKQRYNTTKQLKKKVKTMSFIYSNILSEAESSQISIQCCS